MFIGVAWTPCSSLVLCTVKVQGHALWWMSAGAVGRVAVLEHLVQRLAWDSAWSVWGEGGGRAASAVSVTEPFVHRPLLNTPWHFSDDLGDFELSNFLLVLPIISILKKRRVELSSTSYLMSYMQTGTAHLVLCGGAMLLSLALCAHRCTSYDIKSLVQGIHNLEGKDTWFFFLVKSNIFFRELLILVKA